MPKYEFELSEKLVKAIEHFEDSPDEDARVLISTCSELAWAVFDLSLGRTIYSETKELAKVLTHTIKK